MLNKRRRRLLSAFLATGLIGCSGTPKQHGAWVEVPAGTYDLGSPATVRNPVHRVQLSAFRIAPHELTNAEFNAFVDATGHVTDAERKHDALVFEVGLDEFRWKEDSTATWRYPNGRANGGLEERMDHPVTTISFNDALAYCEWAGVRLPTLDEWEAACRAGTKGRWYWGDDAASVDTFANIWKSPSHRVVVIPDEHLTTAPVGSYAPNSWGLYDMIGNVFEFCSDKPSMLDSLPTLCCARGGSWWCSAHACGFYNAVDIGRVNRRASFSNQGLRVVAEESP